MLVADNRPIASTIPEEGATSWADTSMMHTEAKHPNCAYLWLNHSLSIKLQRDKARTFGAVPVVPAACKNNQLLSEEDCRKNGFNDFAKLWFWRTPMASCETQSACVPYAQWVKDYIAILGN